MNQFKHMKKILKQCIHQLDESINVNLKMYSFDHLRMYNFDHIDT